LANLEELKEILNKSDGVSLNEDRRHELWGHFEDLADLMGFDDVGDAGSPFSTHYNLPVMIKEHASAGISVYVDFYNQPNVEIIIVVESYDFTDLYFEVDSFEVRVDNPNQFTDEVERAIQDKFSDLSNLINGISVMLKDLR